MMCIVTMQLFHRCKNRIPGLFLLFDYQVNAETNEKSQGLH